ncbi:MAG: histidine kinase dimerization/phospho-acceptor domain-containing protein, partial [Gemmatimonas sp.]
MSSIRARLTLAYAATFVGALFLFSISLLVARREFLLQDMETRVQAESDQVVRVVDAALSTGIEAVLAQNDPLAGPSVSARMRVFLRLLDGYVLVQDSATYDIYSSPMVDRLSTDDRYNFGQSARASRAKGPARRVNMRSDEILLATREIVLGNQARYRVYAGLSIANIDLAPPDLLATLVIVGPLLLSLSVMMAYVIAGRAFLPIDRIIDQVEAITDGRSLHRRLAIGAAGDELARLSTTLNAFIERLETSFGALRRFTADASHELKTPLTVMRADVERAMSPVFSANEQAVALEEALQQLTRMADLVDSLLTLARADEGRFDLYREPVAVGDLAREVVETARLLGEDAALTITARTLEDVLVMGDLTRLRQLFLNLVTNAIKYTPRGGTVEITLTH